jgi:hypothetical protein
VEKDQGIFVFKYLVGAKTPPARSVKEEDGTMEDEDLLDGRKEER